MKTNVSKTDFFPKPKVSAICNGVAVYSYGYTHVYGESPDLVDAVSMQVKNDVPLQKMRLKKSSEIISNFLGGTTPRMPRTVENDCLPLEPVHLIDGDPTTCWSSRPVAHPDAEPAWIRIDLAGEKDLTAVTLVKRIPGAARNKIGSMPMCSDAVEVGMAIPNYLEIKLSCDGMTWETVFAGESGDSPNKKDFVYKFTPRKAKQIWIIGKQFKRVENWHHSFSVASVQVFDEKGDNWALASRGTGVTVSSTHHSNGQTREEHHHLWPILSDLGLKWIRIGYHDDPVNWHWVEKEKGKYLIDPETDAAVTHTVENGIDIILSLGFGNRLYTQKDTSRKLPQLWEWYYENPAPPTTPAALKAWANYVRFMCRHFRDRVKVFEVWNEWTIPIYWGAKENLQDYLALARLTIPIIRKECPKAKVMLGSTANFCHGFASWSPKVRDEQAKSQWLIPAVRELGKYVDLIGWHPFYQAEPGRITNYRADVLAFKTWAREQGFRGECSCTEYNYGANYPAPAGSAWWGNFTCSEIEKAKYVARISTLHTALNMGSFFCEVWGHPGYPLDLSLMRKTFSADPISPLQPQAAYYVMRNLATALDGLEAAEFVVHMEDSQEEVEICPMARGKEKVVAFWTKGLAKDKCPGSPVRLMIDGLFKSVIGYDCLNGVEQPLRAIRKKQQTIVEGVYLKDYPILLRFTGAS